MKYVFTLLAILFSFSAFAELSVIHSIDDYETPKNYVEVSEEGLPTDHYQQLLQRISIFRFTLTQDLEVKRLFEKFKMDSRARMRVAGGSCSTRRAYIQNQLRKMNIVSGKLLIHCPSNAGRLRLRDQVSGRYYTFSNFHDTNIVAIKSGNSYQFRVLDVQFEPNPVSLHDYLTEIEASQRIQPVQRRGTSSGRNICYWYISTPYSKFK